MHVSKMSASTGKRIGFCIIVIIVIIGLLFIVGSNTFDMILWKIDIDSLLANIGALIFFIGGSQWIYDEFVRDGFFTELRTEILGNSSVARSGIIDFQPDSKDIDFEEFFLTSNEVVIGVNYSPKLIDNSIGLIQQRCKKLKKTTIIVVNQEGFAGRFLETDYESTEIKGGIKKIQEIIDDCNKTNILVSFIKINTILRYSFVVFDSRIWIVIGTNGKGRRPVPGFFVRSNSPWFQHFYDDVTRLLADGGENG